MSIFGWSLPPGCLTLPGEEPEPLQPRCTKCGGYLPIEPTSTEPNTEPVADYGDNPPPDAANVKPIDSPFHDGVQWYQWTTVETFAVLVWTCKRCGHENRVADY